MNFISYKFLVFLALVFACYFLSPKKIRWGVLLVFSYIFYIMSGLDNLVYILFTTLTTFFGGLWLGRLWDRQKAWLAAEDEDRTKADIKKYKKSNMIRRRLVLALILVLNFGVLVFLKYYNFTASIVGTLPELELLLPLGISFYTFQSAGYVIDQYRGKYEPDRNLAKYALFVSFFPQIVQGPINRYSDIAKQLYAPNRLEYRRCKFGLQLAVWGYFQKIVIADRLIIICINVFDNLSLYSGFEIWAVCLLYGVQLYCDFAGGIDICRGVAQILGVDMAENFRQPFFATSMADFWRRWHISLGDWMKDYLYYPIAMSKPIKALGKWGGKHFGIVYGSLMSNCIPSLVIFFLIGIWHDASWQYVAFGLYNGLVIAGSVLLTPLYAKLNKLLRIDTERFSFRLFQMIRTLFFVTISRMLVRPSSWEDMKLLFTQSVASFNPWILADGTLYSLGLDRDNLLLAAAAVLVLLVVGIVHERGVHIREWLDRQGLILRWTVMLAAIMSVLIFGIYGPGFRASEFIYQVF